MLLNCYDSPSCAVGLGQPALSQTHSAQFGNEHSRGPQEIWTWAPCFGEERNVMVVHAHQTLWLAKSSFACITRKGLSQIWLHKVQRRAREMPVNQIFQSRL